jgi:hypothetical protein
LPPKYEDVKTIRDPKGLCAVISKKLPQGDLSVAFFKEFDRGGQTERSGFMSRRHLSQMPAMIALAGEAMDEITDADRAAARIAEDAKRRA